MPVRESLLNLFARGSAWDKTARLHVPQPFGCDFGKVDADGEVMRQSGPPGITSSRFYGYGADVIAVADGRVVTIRDDIPEKALHIYSEKAA